jgi:hypothetical protein
MPPEDLTSFDVSHLETLAQLEADRRAIRSLSDKAARRRDKEIEIYKRVMADYDARLAANTVQAEPIRQRIREDFQKLEVLYHRYSEALDQARVQLEECEFRREIGEFTQEQFRSCQQDAERTIGEREAEFESVTKLRERYLELLPDERVAQMAVAQTAPAPAVPSSAPSAAALGSAAGVQQADVSTERPDSLASASASGTLTEPFTSSGPVHTVFLRPPSESDFNLPRIPTGGDTAAFGTIPLSAALLIEDRDGLPGAHHRLGLSTDIGRTPDNHIVVPIKEVSRHHAQIVMQDGVYIMKDLDSPNGTFVNGERISDRRLEEGDKVTVGGKVFIFKAP